MALIQTFFIFNFPLSPSHVMFPIGTLSSTILPLFPFRVLPCYSSLGLANPLQGASPMEWTTPQHEEINLSCEVSSYANAEL